MISTLAVLVYISDYTLRDCLLYLQKDYLLGETSIDYLRLILKDFVFVLELYKVVKGDGLLFWPCTSLNALKTELCGSVYIYVSDLYSEFILIIHQLAIYEVECGVLYGH